MNVFYAICSNLIMKLTLCIFILMMEISRRCLTPLPSGINAIRKWRTWTDGFLNGGASFFHFVAAVTAARLLYTRALAQRFHGSAQPTEFVGLEHVFQLTAAAVGMAFKKVCFLFSFSSWMLRQQWMFNTCATLFASFQIGSVNCINFVSKLVS